MMDKSGRIAFLAMVTGLMTALTTMADAQDAEDSLFSSVRASTAFDEEIVTNGRNSNAIESKRLTSAEQLVHALQEGNFESTASGPRTAATKKQLDSWSFPVLVTLSDDEQDVSIVFGLRAVSDSQKVPVTRLLQLLENNEKSGRTSFAFNRERNRIELFSLVKNSGVSAQSLRDEINRLAVIARDTESLWNLEESAGGTALTQIASENGGATKIVGQQAATVPVAPSAPVTPSAPAATSPTVNAPPATAPTTVNPEISVSSLHGRWSASRSATEAFAVQLNADNTFVLVSVSNGKQGRSTGKYTLQNGQLTLETGEGDRLQVRVTLTSASEFRFEQQTAGATGAVVTFRKAQ